MQQGFVQGPEKEGAVNVVMFSGLPLPSPPLPLRAFNIQSQGSTWEEFAGPENICIAPKAEQRVEQ